MTKPDRVYCCLLWSSDEKNDCSTGSSDSKSLNNSTSSRRFSSFVYMPAVFSVRAIGQLYECGDFTSLQSAESLASQTIFNMFLETLRKAWGHCRMVFWIPHKTNSSRLYVFHTCADISIMSAALLCLQKTKTKAMDQITYACCPGTHLNCGWKCMVGLCASPSKCKLVTPMCRVPLMYILFPTQPFFQPPASNPANRIAKDPRPLLWTNSHL